MAEMKDLFNLFDIDGNGSITQEPFNDPEPHKILNGATTMVNDNLATASIFPLLCKSLY